MRISHPHKISGTSDRSKAIENNRLNRPRRLIRFSIHLISPRGRPARLARGASDLLPDFQALTFCAFHRRAGLASIEARRFSGAFRADASISPWRDGRGDRGRPALWRDRVIGEDLAPFAERLVGGDEGGAALVAGADEFEQDGRFPVDYFAVGLFATRISRTRLPKRSVSNR